MDAGLSQDLQVEIKQLSGEALSFSHLGGAGLGWGEGGMGWQRVVLGGAGGTLGVNDYDRLLTEPGKAVALFYLSPGGGEGWRPALFPSMLG